MTKIQFETGHVVNFDGTPTQADIDEVALSIGATPQKQETQSKSFFRPKELISSIGKNISEPLLDAGQQLSESVAREKTGEMGAIEGAVRTVGTGLGQGAQAGIESVFGVGLDLVSAIVPDFIEDPVRRATGKNFNKLMQTDAGLSVIEAAQGIEASFNEMQPKNQQAIKDVFDLALTGLDFATGGTTSKTVKKGLQEGAETIGKKGTQLVDDAGRKTLEESRDKLSSLIIDDSTPTKRTALAGRTEEGGAFTGRKINLTDNENLILDEISQITGINPSRSALFNKNILDDSIGKEARKLTQQITDDNFIFPKKEVASKLDEALDILKREDTDVIGDAEKLADRIFAKMKVFVDAEDGTGLGGFNARKNFDKWVRSKKPKAFEKQDAFNTIVRKARGTVNDFIAEKAPTAPVKESLLKQSRLINASDTLGVKAGKEAGTGFIRLIDKASGALGTKNKVVQLLAAGVGIGGLGAAATFAPAAAGIGGLAATALLVKKALTSPATKKKLGKVLLEIEKQLPKASGAERIILLEIKEEIRTLIQEENTSEQD